MTIEHVPRRLWLLILTVVKGRQQGPVLVHRGRHELTPFPKGGRPESSPFEQFLSRVSQFVRHERKISVKGKGRYFLETHHVGVWVIGLVSEYVSRVSRLLLYFSPRYKRTYQRPRCVPSTIVDDIPTSTCTDVPAKEADCTFCNSTIHRRCWGVVRCRSRPTRMALRVTLEGMQGPPDAV